MALMEYEIAVCLEIGGGLGLVLEKSTVAWCVVQIVGDYAGYGCHLEQYGRLQKHQQCP
jgi:hypothetical protein